MPFWRTALAAAVAGALALAAPAQASHQYRDTVRCASKTVRGVQVIASSSEATAFRKQFPGRRYASYACMRRGAGSIERLKGSEFTLSRVQPKLAGRFVAFRQLFELNEFAAVSGIVVLDMRTGAIVHESPDDGNAYLLSWVLKRNGSAAWIDSLQDQPGSRVFKFDATTGGDAQQLDSGAVDPQSLRLSSDRRQVLWTKSGAEQSAPID